MRNRLVAVAVTEIVVEIKRLKQGDSNQYLVFSLAYLTSGRPIEIFRKFIVDMLIEPFVNN